MYAIIATGGKQYKVSEGDVLRVEKLSAEAGEKITFDIVDIADPGNTYRFAVEAGDFKDALNFIG